MLPDPALTEAATSPRRSRARTSLRRALPGAALMALGVAAFLGLLDVVEEWDSLSAVDRPVLTWLADRRGDAATGVLRAVTSASGPAAMLVIAAVVCAGWALLRRERWRPALLAGSMVLSAAVSAVLKAAVGRDRPPFAMMDVPGAETTGSFPSGHTLGAATLLLVAAYLSCSRSPSAVRVLIWSLATVVVIGLVALSRLYLGYHFLTDVLAAMALAVAVTGAVAVVDRGWRGDGTSGPGQLPGARIRS